MLSRSATKRPAALLRRRLQPQAPALTARRAVSTSPGGWTQANPRVSTLFGALMAVGVASTAYGVYQFYTTFTMWPPEVRGDLRAGIKAKHQGDLDLSVRYLHRAWQTAQSLPISAFATEPHLKLSGVAVALAEALEGSNRPQEAYDIYSAALLQLRAAKDLTGRERMRAVAIAHKLGEMAEIYQQGPEEAEPWLTFAVEETLRVVKDESNAKKGRGAGEPEGEVGSMLVELDLPQWVQKTDVVAPLEALGRFYAREGKNEYAATLYLQAIGMLMQPATGEKNALVEDRCRGAQLMNNMSDLMVRGPPPTNLKFAESWARQAQGVIEKTRTLPGAQQDVENMALCEQTLAAVLYNLGALLEMDGRYDAAKQSFQESLEQSKRIGMRAGAMEARSALRRLERAAKIEPSDKA
ncbi:uncharacterized protein TRAVEDRAFT_172666 [Trametes versicolor FP-101664 SS1]|uniref:uncharacterized protein n=1 Tax=Trametes versicolor (strain FP-101664) TaxID=717944 RepID=UPI0004622D25|nr:uncharacterized protein TRAVEDRAFT_172666 [Trametes versicolor FP-101664 SS1]EIW55029.1 hypothetical protein TRAVEDRAFT_172666 [Trametes versicolor FP-101664 SS1]